MERKGGWRAMGIHLLLTCTWPELKFTGDFGEQFRLQFTEALNHLSKHE